MNTTRITTARVAALFGAVAVTGVLLGAQLGLARHYEGEAGALAVRQAVQPLAQASAAAARTPG